MVDKSKLGGRYVCFSCGTKFYDLNRPEPTCPECGTDQRQAPVRDMKSLLAGKGPVRRPRKEEEEEEARAATTSTDEDEDLGLLDEVDEDEDDSSDDEEEGSDDGDW